MIRVHTLLLNSWAGLVLLLVVPGCGKGVAPVEQTVVLGPSAGKADTVFEQSYDLTPRSTPGSVVRVHLRIPESAEIKPGDLISVLCGAGPNDEGATIRKQSTGLEQTIEGELREIYAILVGELDEMTFVLENTTDHDVSVRLVFRVEKVDQPDVTDLNELQANVVKADAKLGKVVAFQCSGCHTFEQGERVRVGPNLFDIFGRSIGSVEGFPYSYAFSDLNDQGATWTLERLHAFLTHPQADIPGTWMVFAGFNSQSMSNDLYKLLAYLLSLHAN